MGNVMKVFALVAAGMLVAGCGGDTGTETGTTDTTDTIEVTGTEDLRYDPDSFTVAAGEEVTVELTTEGVEHDFNIEAAADVGSAGAMDMEEDDDDHMGVPEEDLEVVHVEADSTGTGTFTIDEPGTYTVYCAVPGHRAAGMEATLEVVEATE